MLRRLGEQLGDGLVDLPATTTLTAAGALPSGLDVGHGAFQRLSSLPPIATVSPLTTTTNFSSGTAAGWSAGTYAGCT